MGTLLVREEGLGEIQVIHLYEVGLFWYINLGGLRLDMTEGMVVVKEFLVYYRGVEKKPP